MLAGDFMNVDPIVSSARAMLEHLSARLSGSVNPSSIADFVRHATDVGPYAHYKIFPQDARLLIPDGVLANGDKASQVFLKAAILHGMLDTLRSDRFRRLPSRIRDQQLRQLQRMLVNDQDAADWLQVDNDIFQKEFGIATLRLYVAGAQLVDPRCGIPRSILFKGGLGALPENAGKILRLGGFRKYFQIHTHDLMLDTFNEEGWNECYRSCAELYAFHPEVLGMYGSSWFYDPAIDTVSPRLSYLRATPVAGGAELFFVEEGGSAKNNALSTSPTRRQLYQEGRYSPRNYMLAWGKAKQMAWAKNRATVTRPSAKP
jgi:hypothetical protein